MVQQVDSLSVDLRGFRDSVQRICKRGRLTIDLMRREDADQSRLNHEEAMINGELRELRIRTVTSFQETLTQIIRDNGLS